MNRSGNTPVGSSGAVQPRLVALLLLLALLPGAAGAGQKERLMFRAQPASAYPARDAHEGIVVAADPFDAREKSAPVFGKHDLRKAGILPILLVITNDTDRTVRLDKFRVQFLTRDRQKLEPTPAEAVVQRLTGKAAVAFPPDTRSPIPKVPRTPSRKDGAVEVLAHEFNMRMVPPKSSASGFLYFDVGRNRDWLPGSSVYLTDLIWAHNSQPLLFFEVKLDDALKAKQSQVPSP